MENVDGSTFHSGEIIPVLQEYKTSLDDLTQNKKPHISMLTVLAEENVQHAQGIVNLIEARISEAPPHQKLPSLYLIDSIVKAYGKDYSEIFSLNLINTFLCVFEKAEAKVRHDLFKLRTTWNNMFSTKLLYDLDISVKQIDPNWPVRAIKTPHSSGLSLEERVHNLITKSPQHKSPNEFSSDEEYTVEYSTKNSEVLVEEEEFELDEEKFNDLEELEKVLAKKQQELDKLEKLDESPSSTGTSNANVQTDIVGSNAVETRHKTEMMDQATQYRYRKKTKNFLSQFRPPCKNVATYFRIKTKEVFTQYDPDEVAAVGIDFPPKLEQKTKSKYMINKEKAALKDYLMALKDDFLPQGYSNHAGMVVRSLQAQRRQSMLCDITLSSEGRHFKAHKAILASASEFFHALFVSEALKQTSLSYVELQGITAKALSSIIDYIYTSVIPLGTASQIEEIIIAANQLKIQSLLQCCPSLEQALAKKIDLTGWLISNMKLLSPSDKMPYVEAVENLRGYPPSSYSSYKKNGLPCDKDGFADDVICHVDRDSRKHSTEDFSDRYSHDEVDGLKRKASSDAHQSGKRLKVSSDTDSSSEVSKKHKFDNDTWKPAKIKKSGSKDKAYQCMVCNRILINKHNFISHCDAHARKGEKPFFCRVCNKRFWKEGGLTAHVQKTHSDLTPSEMKQACRVKTVSISESTEAEATENEATPTMTLTNLTDYRTQGKLKCAVCPVIAPNETVLARHLRTNHPHVQLPSSYRFQCKYCKSCFKTANARAVHIKTHLKDSAGHSVKKNKKKDNADMEYTPEGAILGVDKMETEQGKEDDELNPTLKLKLYHCDICGEMFSVQCFYKAHMAGHKKNLED